MKFVPSLLAASICSAVFAASAAVPVVTDTIAKNAELMNADPAMQALLKEATSEEAQKWRFNTLLELARIASPSRFEMRRQAEITRRLVEEWGFAPEDVLTRPDGFLKGAGVQTVDGKPVYNVCVRIPGTYGARPDAVSYKGQLPKVVLEGHIDTVNPGVLPPAETPYEAVKLQKVSDPIVKTREELKALALEVRFDKNGKVIEDEVWKKAYHRFNDLEEAKKKGGYRIYVPGFEDAMINTVAVMQTAKLMKKHNIRPVYDIWVCGTTGEEGKGNLCGMKQLYGYSQEAGKGNNALNIVANFGADSTMPGDAIVNYIGSYRFEIKYTEPAGWKAGEARPSAAMAMSRAIASISDLKTAWDLDKKAEKTTYTVGVASCDDPAKSRSTNCTLMVDMRSPTQAPLSAIRAQIEPEFKKAMDAENAKYGLKTGDKNAVSMELVWFGDRPAYQRPHYNDIAMQAYWQASKTADIDVVKAVPEEAASLNDNVPAAVGVPTVNVNLGTVAGGGGGHTWYEWGVPGNGVDEGKRLYRFLMMGLLASGYNMTDGKVLEPGVARWATAPPKKCSSKRSVIMKNIRKILRPAAALLLSLAAAGAMAGSQSVSVSIIGPGGHSNGDYGNVNAVHAAARSIMLIEKSVPDAVVTAVTGGNSVNSIAAYTNFRVLLEGDDAALKAKADKVKAAVEEGCKAENAFRGVKTGEVRDGLAADIRWTIK